MLVLGLAGCADPYDWRNTWNASQVNAVNLAAQAVDWRDLQRGHASPGTDGKLAADAVDRLRRGAVKPLPDTTILDVPAQSAPAAPALPPAAAGT